MRNPYRSLRAGLAVLSAAAFLAFSPANVLAEETLTSQTGQAVQQTEAAQQTGAAQQIVTGPGAVTRPSTNGVSIYISKMGNTLTLKQYATVIGTWPAKLGRQQSSGDKVQEGDEITPSGKFYVCTRNDKSLYYLALGLSYPSEEDAQRGLAQGLITQEQYDAIVKANRNGEQPPWDTPLGGAIEIHGNQGDGGTAGCIAMTNDVMDILWSYCNIGVPVTIGP